MSENNPIGKYAEHLSLGAEIAVGLSAPILLGYWLDTYFESSPWILLAGCLVGIVNIFLIILHISKGLD